MVTTTENIMDALEALTITGTPTVTRRFQVIDDDFEDFPNFPLVVVATGDEECEPLANLQTESNFHPTVHFFGEGISAAAMETWRKSIRTSIIQDTTLRGLSINVHIEKIKVYLAKNKKLQRLIFSLGIIFDIDHD